jgi:hypothetical protein
LQTILPQNHNSFSSNYTGIDNDFCELHKQIKDYRDNFVAHLDSDDVMRVPFLDNALKLVYFYYSEVTKRLVENERRGLPADIESYYGKCLNKSRNYFDQHNKRQKMYE